MDMARKMTSSKKAARRPEVKARGATKAASRVPPAKTAVRKAPAAKVQAKVQAKSTPKAASTKADQARKVVAKKAPAPVKPVLGKVPPKPIAVPKAAAPQAGARLPVPPPKAAVMTPSLGAASRPAASTPVRAMPAMNKQPGQTITAPATPKAVADKAALARQQAAAANKKPVSQRHGFKTNEWIVYPAHGVGRIVGIEEQEIAGMSLELFVITFEKDKMTLRVPTGKSQSVGMRKLAEEGVVRRAMETLKGRARIKRTMWSRRAQEYEAKINSGDLISIAEVVRDLYRSESQPEQSYSERQLYEAALDRMAREIAAVDKLDERGAVQRITEVLSKSAKGRRLAAEEAEVKAA